MDQKTIARVFDIEKRAAKIHDEAQQQAKQILTEARRAVKLERERKLQAVRQEAAQILAQSKQAAQEDRKKILAEAEAEAQQLVESAQQNFEQAVNFVLSRVAGRE